jgi:hydrogenase nickel incorporation protein HypB
LTTRLVEVRQNVLHKNDVLARTLRVRFQTAGTLVISLVSSPGSGKTALLERTLRGLAPTLRVAALVGDLATDRDATRLARSGAPVRQICTGTICHLDAAMVEGAIEDWDVGAFDVLFIENVGNLVCPASYDLGEERRVVLMSVTEGEDKPLKYPTIFNTADAVVITKTDLSAAVRFDRAEAVGNITAVWPDLEIMEVSALSGSGMDAWLCRVREWAHSCRERAIVGTHLDQTARSTSTT